MCRVSISVQVASRVSQLPLRGAAVSNQGQNRPSKHQKVSLTPLLVGFINGIDPKGLSMKVVLYSLHGKLLSKSFRGRDVQLFGSSRMSRWTAVSRGIALDLGIYTVGPIARSTAQALQKGIRFNPPLARMPLQLEITDLESSDHIGALNQQNISH